jgi:hypothetical protein
MPKKEKVGRERKSRGREETAVNICGKCHRLFPSLCFLSIIKVEFLEFLDILSNLGLVAHTYIPSYSGDRHQEDKGLRTAWPRSS